MLTRENIEKLSTKYQTTPLTVAREYCQHNFLASFYNQKGAEKFLFKGGTALRIIYQSPRFSEDLDFTGVYHITYSEIEDILTDVLRDLNAWGLEVDLEEAKKTTGGYLAKINFSLHRLRFFIKVEISFRQSREKIERRISVIRNEYIHTYNIVHLSQDEIIKGKLKALLSRAKARDWYDFYFFIHNQMLNNEHKEQLQIILEKLKRTNTDFKRELKDFLPRSHQIILKDFKANLTREIKRYL